MRGSMHRYCVFASDGQISKCHGAQPGGGIHQLRSPSGVAVDPHGRAYIADSMNNRIVVLEPETLAPSLLSVEGGVIVPAALHLDTARGRLYIGEWGGQRRVVVLGV